MERVMGLVMLLPRAEMPGEQEALELHTGSPG